MTVLVTSDLHFNSKEIDRYRHQFVDTMVDVVKSKRVDTLLILGDLTDEKDNHGAWLTNAVVSHIVRLSGWCRVIIIRGNHDCISPSEPFFAFLGKFPNVVWINEPTIYHVFADEKSLLLPHTHDYKRDWDGFKIRTFNSVFTHNTFKGSVSETGHELDGILPSVFSKTQTVISGDVHVPQGVGAVEYVGSPYGVNFGKDIQHHMILMKSPQSISYIFYEGPRKLVMDVPLGAELGLEGWRKGDILKIRVQIDASEFKVYQEYKNQLYKLFDGSGCVLAMVQPIVEPGGGVVTTRRLLRKKDDEAVLKSYASAVGVREPVVKTGVRILKKG